MKEELINRGWEFISDKDSATDYFIRKYKDPFKGYTDGFLILSKPIDENLKNTSRLKIEQYSLGSMQVYTRYVGGCNNIEEFDYLCKLLDI